MQFSQQFPTFVMFSFPGLTTALNSQGIEKKTPIKMVAWKNLTESKIIKSHKGVAVLTGKKSNITVFDFDNKESYDKLLNSFPELKNNMTVETKNGYHIYFNYDADIETSVRVLKDYDCVDIRNDNAIIFCPPTSYNLVDESKFKYKLLGGDLLDVPQYLKDNIKKPKESTESQINLNIKETPKKIQITSTKQINKHMKQIDTWLENDDLNFIAESDSWEDWRDVGFMFKNTSDSKQFFERFDEFSQINSKYDSKYTKSFWESIKPPTGNALTIATLYKKVKDHEQSLKGGGFIHDSDIIEMGNGFADYKVSTYIYNKYCFVKNETTENKIKKNQIIVSTGIKNKDQTWFLFINDKWTQRKDNIFLLELVSNQFHNDGRL